MTLFCNIWCYYGGECENWCVLEFITVESGTHFPLSSIQYRQSTQKHCQISTETYGVIHRRE
jgi:hypothetical protein